MNTHTSHRHFGGLSGASREREYLGLRRIWEFAERGIAVVLYVVSHLAVEIRRGRAIILGGMSYFAIT
jgi:hypothetical protein